MCDLLTGLELTASAFSARLRNLAKLSVLLLLLLFMVLFLFSHLLFCAREIDSLAKHVDMLSILLSWSQSSCAFLLQSSPGSPLALLSCCSVASALFRHVFDDEESEHEYTIESHTELGRSSRDLRSDVTTLAFLFGAIALDLCLFLVSATALAANSNRREPLSSAE